MRTEALAAGNLTFSNSAGRVLSNISFRLYEGEILGIVGINGVGKTVLAQILAGLVRPEAGKITVGDGAAAGPELLRRRVGYVGEDPQLLENLTVAENLVLGMRDDPLLYCSRRALYSAAQRILDDYRFTVRPQEIVSRLSYSQMKEVQLARQLANRPRVLILDELADAFSNDALDNLQQILQELAARGTAVLYTSHNYEDVMRFASRILILRGAALVAELPRERFDRRTIRRITYGEDPAKPEEPALPPAGREERERPEVFRACNMRAGDLKPVSFAVRQGEILGIAGLVGSGKSLIAQCIGGHLPLAEGQLYIQGRRHSIASPRDAVRNGVGLCLEKRGEMLLAGKEPVSMNISLSVIGRLGDHGILSRKKERLLVQEYCRRLKLDRQPGEKTAALNNADLMKIAVARCLAANPRVLVLDEPNRELDIDGVRNLCGLLEELRGTCGIILLFSKIDDLAQCCDRTLVMHGGGVIGTLGRGEVSYSGILRMIEEGGAAHD